MSIIETTRQRRGSMDAARLRREGSGSSLSRHGSGSSLEGQQNKKQVPHVVEKAGAMLDDKLDETIYWDEEESVFNLPRGTTTRLGAGGYIRRLYRGAKITVPIFMGWMELLTRYFDRTGTAPNQQNIHRLLLASLVVAIKTTTDSFYSNTFYATVGDVSLASINRLERAFLEALDWEVTVTVSQYHRMYRYIEATDDKVSGSSANAVRALRFKTQEQLF